MTLRTVAATLRRDGVTYAGILTEQRKALVASEVPAGTSYNTTSGVLTVTGAGVRLDAFDLPVRVDIRAPGFHCSRSLIRGNGAPKTYDQALVMATHQDVRDAVFEDVVFRPDVPSPWVNGINGHDFALLGCDVADVVDGVGIFNTHAPGAAVNVTIDRGTHIHDLAYFAVPSTVHADLKTHNDCVQVQGGRGIALRNSTLTANLGQRGEKPPPVTDQVVSGLMVNANVGAVGDLVVEDNLFEFGFIPVNATGRNLSGLNLGRIWRNRFDGRSYAATTPPQTISRRADVTFDAGEGTANVNRLASGVPVLVRVLA